MSNDPIPNVTDDRLPTELLAAQNAAIFLACNSSSAWTILSTGDRKEGKTIHSETKKHQPVCFSAINAVAVELRQTRTEPGRFGCFRSACAHEVALEMQLAISRIFSFDNPLVSKVIQESYQWPNLGEVNAAIKIESALASERRAKGEVQGKTNQTGQEKLGVADPTFEANLPQLEPAWRKAFLAFTYAESKNGRRMEDREAYDWLRENDIDQSKGDLGELMDWDLPNSFETFSRYLRGARNCMGESKNTKRRGRHFGPSVVPAKNIEFQKDELK